MTVGLTVQSFGIITKASLRAKLRGMEACGLLTEREPRNGTRVLTAVEVRNVADRADMFIMDPEEYRRKVERWGVLICGTWHSHPCGIAQMSSWDEQSLRVMGTDWVHLVMGMKYSGMPRLAGWRFEEHEIRGDDGRLKKVVASLHEETVTLVL